MAPDAIVITSDSDTGVEIDLLAATVPPEEINVLRAIDQQVYAAPASEAKAAAASGEWSAIGLTGAVTRALRKGKEAEAVHTSVVERLKATMEATRAKAMQVPASERTTETLLAEREIRDRLVGRDALEVNALYVTAITNGDWTTVNAVERAPASFPLLPAEMVEQGKALRLAKSPLAGQLAAEEAAYCRYASVLASSRTQLANLAKQHGLDLDAVK